MQGEELRRTPPGVPRARRAAAGVADAAAEDAAHTRVRQGGRARRAGCGRAWGGGAPASVAAPGELQRASPKSRQKPAVAPGNRSWDLSSTHDPQYI